MYPSLPKAEVIREVERRIRKNDFKTKFNKEALIRLVKISVEFMSFRIKNKFYNQADGLFIGSPASPCFAEIYVQRIEEASIYTMLHAPRIWLRKVDDTFTVTKYTTEQTLNELNEIHEKVKFTAEEEENGKIPFLDCLIVRTNDNKLKTKVYRKATHTGQYINYKSNQPLHVKLSTIKTLTRRAKTICTDKEDLKEELNYIRKTMLLNEFPKSLIERTITKTLHNHNNKKKENENENMIRMYIPYEKGISENISRVCRKFNVQLVHTRNKSLNNMVKVKTSQNEDTENVSGVVYKVHCNDCEKCYIGETGRMVKTRMKEHKQDAENKKENVF